MSDHPSALAGRLLPYVRPDFLTAFSLLIRVNKDISVRRNERSMVVTAAGLIKNTVLNAAACKYHLLTLFTTRSAGNHCPNGFSAFLFKIIVTYSIFISFFLVNQKNQLKIVVQTLFTAIRKNNLK